jgi:glycosyltransferase involved in cell wall biosynthesis
LNQTGNSDHSHEHFAFADTANRLGGVAMVIPTYNHWPMVRKVALSASALGLPVFVVDDGSNDGTSDGLAEISGIHLLRHEQNLGKGEALLTGMRAAAKVAEWAITLDSDGQHRPLDALNLMTLINSSDRAMVVGRRQGMDQEKVPWTSRWGREFSNFWVWLACGRWVHDSQSGFRLYPLPESLHLPTRARRFQFEVEVLVQAVWNGLPVLEAPVSVDYQPPCERRSHFRPWLDFWRNTKTFTRLITLRILSPLRHSQGGRA